MNEESLIKNCRKRTPFAPLQCRVLKPNIKSSNRLANAYYLSPLEAESVRHRRAKEFGLTPTPTDSFLHNQSFPGLRKDPENGYHCVDMGSMYRCSIDKFRGDELNSISFTIFPTKKTKPDKNNLLNGSWMLYNYIQNSSGYQSLHPYAYNPKKAILTINARTTEILTANETAFSLLGIEEHDEFLKLSDFILSPENQYLFTEVDLKPNGEVVLFSGKVLYLMTRSKEKKSVSMWARQLPTKPDVDMRCLVIMEPAEWTLGKVWFDSLGKIMGCDEVFANLYCYETADDMVDLNIKDYIPSLELDKENHQGSLATEEGVKLCATGKTKDNFTFPLNITISQCSDEYDTDKDLNYEMPLYEGTVWVFSNISGLITIFPNGRIHSCNTNFSMMLFGYPQTELVGKDISNIIATFYDDLDSLDNNSVALPVFGDEDDDSNAKCENSDGRTTADSIIADLPRPTNPLGRPLGDEKIYSYEFHSHTSTPPHTQLWEKSGTSDHLSNYEDFYVNKNILISKSPSEEIHSSNCDILKKEERSASSVGDSSRQMSCSESQDTLHSDLSGSAESDLNANVLNLAGKENMIEIAATSKDTYSDKDESGSFESESENEYSECNEESYDSEDNVCSEDELVKESSHSNKEIFSPPPFEECKCLNNSPSGKHLPDCFMNVSAQCLKFSTPKQSSCNASKSSLNSSCISIPDGVFLGTGRHKNGTDLAIEYHIKRILLDSGHYLFCIWVSRDPDSIKEGSPTNKTSSSQYDTSQTSQSESAESNASETSILPDEEYAKGPFSEHYTIVQHLAKGAFGCIKKAYRNSDGLLVIAKFVLKTQVYKEFWIYDDALKKKVPLELLLLSTIQHPNIVRVIDTFENDKCFHMIMEKHGCGLDLFEFIERQPTMDECLSSYIFRQVVSALSFLQSINILHRDIKDENVIINEKFHVKLIDFGSAAYIKKGKLFTKFCGTTEYCSPEVLRGEKYRGPELEIFALGVTLFTLVEGQNPFLGANEILKGEYKILKDLSKSLVGLIKHMLEPNPEKRCTLSEVENHPWINQPVMIENYRFSNVIFATDEELQPPKYMSFTESQEDYEDSYISTDSEVSQLEGKVAGIELNEKLSSSNKSEEDNELSEEQSPSNESGDENELSEEQSSSNESEDESVF